MKAASLQLALFICFVFATVCSSKLPAQSYLEATADRPTPSESVQRAPVQRDQVRIDIRGVLRTNQMAIGGETTGTTIEANGLTFELDLQDDPWLQRRAERFSDQVVWVSGRLEARQSPERGQRLLIDARRIGAAFRIPFNRRRRDVSSPNDDPASKTDSASKTDLARKTSFQMEQLQWEHRPLLIFAPSVDDRDYQRQMAELDGVQSQLDERDMVVIRVIGDDRGWIDLRALSEDAIEHLRSRFDAEEDRFLVALVGKDGTTKMRRDEPIMFQTLVQRVDSMPMRRREIEDQRWRRQHVDND